MSDRAVTDPALVTELRQLIDSARQRAAVAVNAELTLLYWQIGRRIHREVLAGKRAGYGEEIVSALGRQLTAEYGRGFSVKNLRHMIRFAEVFPEENIVSTLSRQLSWSHFLEVIYLKEPLAREFYVRLCLEEGWSVRRLRERKETLLFERTAISSKPEETIRHELKHLDATGQPSPQLLLKDPYILDFLGLNDRYLERDLEDVILREIEQFLLELGAGFTFVGRQKRIQVDDEDFYIDLLFYNRKLRRLVAIDLKLGRFKAEYKGQMELYLRWLARHEQEAGENPPLGIILCAGKQREQIELLELDKSGIHVAEYLTVLPPREALKAKLHQSIAAARARLQGGQDEPTD
ncbi:YhcG family protein [Halomonas sp. A11-A]|uniref:PDDEXK nuclease domain-containing protein n=1 Tax=Halomonas sp. A11-A TaxID=2183985 RepID=UPI000D70E68D|nr:PDDEXK nuclease domain-containing protein [Halomonas sp. A11-A]PWV77386.1 putative nuclease of restriction endonuclease-like (RecB) superfamily [Halomonas sp. A11-A]